MLLRSLRSEQRILHSDSRHNGHTRVSSVVRRISIKLNGILKLSSNRLLGAIIRGRKKASYNHFDSYPSGLGVGLVNFIKYLSDDQIQEMIKRYEEIEWSVALLAVYVQESELMKSRVEERTTAPRELQQRYIAAGFANLGVSEQRPGDWYCLIHKMQGVAGLPHILDGSLKHLVDSTEFENDTLFCEGIYYVDWEKKELKVISPINGGTEAMTDLANLSVEWMRSLEQALTEDGASSDEDGADSGEDGADSGEDGADSD